MCCTNEKKDVWDKSIFSIFHRERCVEIFSERHLVNWGLFSSIKYFSALKLRRKTAYNPPKMKLIWTWKMWELNEGYRTRYTFLFRLSFSASQQTLELGWTKFFIYYRISSLSHRSPCVFIIHRLSFWLFSAFFSCLNFIFYTSVTYWSFTVKSTTLCRLLFSNETVLSSKKLLKWCLIVHPGGIEGRGFLSKKFYSL